MKLATTVLASTLLLTSALQAQGYPEDIAIVPHVGVSLRSSTLERASGPGGFPAPYVQRYNFASGLSYGVGLELHRSAHTVAWRLDYAQTASRSFRESRTGVGPPLSGSPEAMTWIGTVSAIVAPTRACMHGVCARLLGGAGVQHTSVTAETLSDDVVGTLVEDQYSPSLIVGIGARIRLPRGALLIDLRDEMSRFRLGGSGTSTTQLLHTPNLSFGLALPLRGGV